ncbi:hypothetical protein BDF20DRAFT_873251 [Mycotypha africana]|uniref:uncharacterized protein n=1 Tax=Mycotypha africana TaxID=64632 RepID=UPI002301DE8D|nr:uncharacterized protein BDF20DRAFT_873251 [Mycotypha africana]KAI8977145.1 hypothetical protein BDF20DRAFT_873251 [Mycotypha africana]
MMMRFSTRSRSKSFKKTLSFHSFRSFLLLLQTMSSSIGVNCTELKKKYDNCFNKWYSEKFLKGDTTPECEELFKDYRACVMVKKQQP